MSGGVSVSFPLTPIRPRAALASPRFLRCPRSPSALSFSEHAPA